MSDEPGDDTSLMAKVLKLRTHLRQQRLNATLAGDVHGLRVLDLVLVDFDKALNLPPKRDHAA